MQEFAKAVEVIEDAFVGDFVVLVTAHAAAEAGLEERVGEVEFEPGPTGANLLLVGDENFLEQFGGEDAVLKGVENAHDPRHVDAFAIGGEGDGSRNGGFEEDGLTVGLHEAEGQAKVGNPYLEDGHIGSEDGGAALVLSIRERLVIFSIHVVADHLRFHNR